jgi:signal transduction histidine kinase/DNA-binding response OmpR family regulator
MYLAKSKLLNNKKLLSSLYIISFAICVLCITSNEVYFVKTEYGNQFLYKDSLIFKISFVYSALVVLLFLAIQILWMFGAGYKRNKKQAISFTILTAVVAPPGLACDFFFPTFTNYQFPPITTVAILIVSVQLYFIMKKNKSLNITAEGASDVIFKSIEIPIFFLDNNDDVVLANNSAVNLFRKISKYSQGGKIYDILHGSNKFIDKDIFEDEFQSKIITLNVSGVEKIYDMSLDVEKDEYGDIFSKVVIFRDITDIHTALDHAVEASKAKGDFLSRMSHEMRTPLNAIIGMAKIGIDSKDGSKMQYCLGRINSSSKHLLALINDILDMSKIESGKIEINSDKFRLNDKIEEIINVISIKAEEKNIDFVVDIDPAIPNDLVGDELRLSQVITNLLSNAVKFTQERGSIHLNIKLNSRVNEQESVIYVEVSDTGIGIHPDHIRKLFHAFEQVDGSIGRRFGGTGLGLAISKKIVEMMGGRIGVHSGLGKGSRFFFTIPLKHSSQPSWHPYHAPLVCKDIRVLVVDESQEIRAYFDRLMTRLRAQYDLFASGSSALDSMRNAVSSEPYHVVFANYLVQNLDGMKILHEMKKISPDSFGVIMVPVSKWDIIESESTQSKVDKFIQKPLVSSAIIEIMGSMVHSGEHHEHVAPDEQRSLQGIFKSNRVLLVEDMELNREIVQALLEETGVAMDFAHNGQEGLHKFMTHPDQYDLILMDMQMPVMDGLEATRKIRALDVPEARAIPIVAMTANAFKEDVDACLASGMNDHIGKPIDFDLLIEKLTKHLAPAPVPAE